MARALRGTSADGRLSLDGRASLRRRHLYPLLRSHDGGQAGSASGPRDRGCDGGTTAARCSGPVLTVSQQTTLVEGTCSVKAIRSRSSRCAVGPETPGATRKHLERALTRLLALASRLSGVADAGEEPHLLEPVDLPPEADEVDLLWVRPTSGGQFDDDVSEREADGDRRPVDGDRAGGEEIEKTASAVVLPQGDEAGRVSSRREDPSRSPARPRRWPQRCVGRPRWRRRMWEQRAARAQAPLRRKRSRHPARGAKQAASRRRAAIGRRAPAAAGSTPFPRGGPAGGPCASRR